MPHKTEHTEVFRQFAWHLAGKLAPPKPAAPPRRPKGGGR
jgi:hypothetical protein